MGVHSGLAAAVAQQLGQPPVPPANFCPFGIPPLVQSVNFLYINWPEEQWVGGACELLAASGARLP